MALFGNKLFGNKLFDNNKKYEEGMEAGAAPFEKIFEDQSKQTAEGLDNIKSSMEEIRSGVEFVMDDLGEQEKKRIYSLDTNCNILTLDLDEKEFAIALLYTLSQLMDETSEKQKEYHLNIQRYLNIKNPQVQIELSSIENIENIKTQKILYRIVSEYLFLAHENFEYEEKIKDIFDYFSINKNSINSIRENIEKIYKALGADGIIEYYGYLSEDVATDSIQSVDEDIEKNSDKILGESDGAADIGTIDSNEQDAVIGLNNIESSFNSNCQKENIFIDNMLVVPEGTIKKFVNASVHVSSIIACAGELVFDNCNIFYNESSKLNNIILEEKASLLITDSVINNLGYAEQVLISGERNNEVVFLRTQFNECSNFLKLYGANKFILQNCNLLNCYKGFIDINYSECINEITKNYIYSENLAEFNLYEDGDSFEHIFEHFFGHGGTLINIYDSNQWSKIEGNTIIESENFYCQEEYQVEIKNPMKYFSGNIKIENCVFTGVQSGIECTTVINCKFMNCKNAVRVMPRLSNFNIESEIKDCIFSGCTNILELDEGTRILKCQFNDCYDTLIEGDISGGATIEYCEFKDIRNYSKKEWGIPTSILLRGDKKGYTNTIKNCIFNGIELDQSYLIAPKAYEKCKRNIIKIEGCDFINCMTKRTDEEIVSNSYYYLGLFNKMIDVNGAVTISACSGLDRINA